MESERSGNLTPLRQHLRRYRAHWEANAKLDALWAVLSLEGKLGGGWDEQAFFRTGDQEIAEVFRFMTERGISLPVLDCALDFGCGVGRLTQALASKARTVVGIDISREMIERARAYFPRITFHLSGEDDLERFGAGTFDLVYTNIVLQHLNGDLQRHYIAEFGRILRPGGLAIFQIPSRSPLTSRTVKTLKILTALRPRTLATLLRRATAERIFPWQARMELNLLPKGEVVRAGEAAGLRLQAIGNIDWERFYAGAVFRLEPEEVDLQSARFPSSHLYFFRKLG